jgi:phage head maturation protease
LKIFDFTLEIKETTNLDDFIKTILGYFEVFNQTDDAIDFKNI